MIEDSVATRDLFTEVSARPRFVPGPGVAWASLDLVIAVLAGTAALHLRGAVTFSFLNKGLGGPMVLGGGGLRATAFIAIFSAYVLGAGQILGLYRAIKTKSFIKEQGLAMQAVFMAVLLLCGTLFLNHVIYASRAVVGFTAVLTSVVMMLSRAVWRSLRERRYLAGLETRNALIIGDGKVGHALRNHFRARPRLGFRFKGFITLDSTEAGLTRPEVLGPIKDCMALARMHFVDEIYFSAAADRALVTRVVDEAKVNGIAVRFVPELYEGLAWNEPVEYVGRFPTIALRHNEISTRAYELKRWIDVCLSVVGLAVLSPLLLLIAVIVKADTRGPALSRAERIGRRGRKFVCFKFRTMRADAERRHEAVERLSEGEGILSRTNNDPRISRSGRWLRRYSLDELPQLVNVFLGEMSLVGPRPPLASEAKPDEVEHLRGLNMLPGITGLWQVEAREEPSSDRYISLDMAYVDTWNLRMDFRIMARTLGAIIQGTGC